MSEQDNKMSNDGVSRRTFLGKSSAALVAAASLPIVAAAQQTKDLSGDNHVGDNERELGPKNPTAEAMEPDSMYPPVTDAGGQPPFKYPFAMSHKRIEDGGWTRQVTVRDFPLSKKMAGVEMRLISGGVRELHWHVSSEWALMTAGSAYHGSRPEGAGVCRGRERRRSLALPRRGTSLNSGFGREWLPIHSGVRRPQL